MHITLGIFYRLWCLLEGSCHELDLELAKRTSASPTDRTSFKEYSALVKQLIPLSEKKIELVQLTSSLNSVLGDLAIQLPNAESHPLVQALKEESHSAAVKLDKVVYIKYMYMYINYSNTHA